MDKITETNKPEVNIEINTGESDQQKSKKIIIGLSTLIGLWNRLKTIFKRSK